MTLFIILSFLSPSLAQKPDSAEVFTPIDKSAEFPGGMGKLYMYFKDEMKMPKSAKKERVNGKVFVSFIVNKDGSILDDSVRVVSPSTSYLDRQSIVTNAECQAEAVRLMKECPNWIPAKQRDKPARQRLVIPIMFKN